MIANKRLNFTLQGWSSKEEGGIIPTARDIIPIGEFNMFRAAATELISCDKFDEEQAESLKLVLFTIALRWYNDVIAITPTCHYAVRLRRVINEQAIPSDIFERWILTVETEFSRLNPTAPLAFTKKRTRTLHDEQKEALREVIREELYTQGSVITAQRGNNVQSATVMPTSLRASDMLSLIREDIQEELLPVLQQSNTVVTSRITPNVATAPTSSM